MAFEFKLPDLGEGVAEGEIIEWKVEVGATVAEDDPLVEVMTDKATVEIPSPRAGVVKTINHEPGAVVPVGDVIVVIASDDATASPTPSAETKTVEEPAPTTPTVKTEPKAPTIAASEAVVAAAPAATGDKILATPATRKLARELGIDVAMIAGTGPRGRITKDDVRGFSGRQAAAPSAQALGSPPARPAAPVLAPLSRPATADESRTAYRGIRRKIGDAMIGSAFTKPHFTLVEEIDMTEVYALRKNAKAEGEARGVKVTFLPFIMKALVAALKQHPTINGIIRRAGRRDHQLSRCSLWLCPRQRCRSPGTGDLRYEQEEHLRTCG